jgi:hypothetical protein
MEENYDESVGNRRSIVMMSYCGNNFLAMKGFIFWDIVTCISVAREQLGTYVPPKKNSWPTIGKGLSIARQRAVNKFCQQ